MRRRCGGTNTPRRHIDERFAIEPDEAAVGPQQPRDQIERETFARARLSEQRGDPLPVGEGDGQLEGSEIEADVNLDHSKLATRFSAQR